MIAKINNAIAAFEIKADGFCLYGRYTQSLTNGQYINFNTKTVTKGIIITKNTISNVPILALELVFFVFILLAGF
jgi:hypothetical protein